MEHNWADAVVCSWFSIYFFFLARSRSLWISTFDRGLQAVSLGVIHKDTTSEGVQALGCSVRNCMMNSGCICGETGHNWAAAKPGKLNQARRVAINTGSVAE